MQEGKEKDVAPWAVHGGRIAAARAAFSDAPGPWIDLSTGINPLPWNVARADPIDWTRLPEEGALTALEAAAADFFGAPAAHVCAVPGSELALRLLATLALPKPARHVAPGYGTHTVALGDSTPIAVEALAAEAARGGTILLANPANPTGQRLASAETADLARTLAAQGGVLVVDEAFADADPSASILETPEAEQAIVLRSFGKFFGLAGVRLGFVIAAPARIAALRQRLGSWPVSAGAIAIGTAAYRDRAWIAATRRDLVARAAQLDALLLGHDLAAEGACPLFRLVRTPRASALFEALARAGILTRPFADQADWLRLGLPADEAAFARLDAALAGA